MPDLRLRPAGPEDDAGIRALLAASYPDNPKTEAAFTRWQYWENPFGPTRSWVWEDDGAIVCHWSAVAVPIVLDGRTVVGAKGVDIATHPDYRRRGLFGRLAVRLTADLAEAGVPVLISHPNPLSVAGVEASGAYLAARVPVHVAALDDAWLARRFHLPGALARGARRRLFPSPTSGHDVDLSDTAPDQIDGLWAMCLPRFGVLRDDPWWDWRYARRPETPYWFACVRRSGQLLAVAAMTEREDFGGRFTFVLDLLALEADSGRAVLAAVRREAEARGAVGVALAAPSRSPAAEFARAGGLRRLPRRLEPSPLRFMVAEPGGNSAALAACDWMMQWSDLDHL